MTDEKIRAWLDHIRECAEKLEPRSGHKAKLHYARLLGAIQGFNIGIAERKPCP